MDQYLNHVNLSMDIITIYLGVFAIMAVYFIVIYAIISLPMIFFLREESKFISAMKLHDESFVTSKAVIWCQLIPVIGLIFSLWFLISSYKQFKQLEWENPDFEIKPSYQIIYGAAWLSAIVISMFIPEGLIFVSLGLLLIIIVMFIMNWVHVYRLRKFLVANTL